MFRKHVPSFLLENVTCLELCCCSSEAAFISLRGQLRNRFPIPAKRGKISYQNLLNCVHKCPRHFSISFYSCFRWSTRYFQLVSFIAERLDSSGNTGFGSSAQLIMIKLLSSYPAESLLRGEIGHLSRFC